MDDAYEIGIRLVLENGVSSGIAALKDDLAAYDRALTATTGRLRTLSQAAGAGIGRGLAAPASAGVAVPTAHNRARDEERTPLDAEVRRRREMPGAAASPAVFKPPQATIAAAPAPPRVSLAGFVGAPLGAALPLPAAPEQAAHAVVEARQDAASLGPGQVSAPAVVTVTARAPPGYARYAPASPANQLPAAAAPETLEGPDSRSVSIPAQDQRETRRAPLVVREPFHPPAWEAVTSRAPTTATDAQMPAAPVAAAASTGPTQGDVFLDGTRVGRWMSDRLARDVDRPQSGVTGFDPRLGPAWPGSLHGT
jgi:hypothetical protein